VSVSSVNVERGAFHQELGQAALKRTLVHIARDSSLLVDATKFRTGGLHRVVELSELQAIYVDDTTDAKTLSTLRSKGLGVHVADRGPTTRTTGRQKNGRAER
jgi:DeoR family fructose operon transcriptional repressor